MLIFLTATPNMVYTVALAVMLLIVLLEVVSVALGAGLSDLVDSLIPEFDADLDVEADADFDALDASPTALDRVLNWFRIGEVPVLMLFVVALSVFGLFGLTLQSVAQAVTGKLLPPVLTIIPVCIISMPVIRVLAGLMGKYMPKDETYIASEKSLMGRVATITAGTASPGSPTQAKVRDEFKQTHYIMVEPDISDTSFSIGDKVILVNQAGTVYQVIDGKNKAFSDN